MGLLLNELKADEGDGGSGDNKDKRFQRLGICSWHDSLTRESLISSRTVSQ